MCIRDRLGGHICDFKGNGLLEADGLAKLNTFLGVGYRFLKSALGDPQRLGGNADPAAVQGCHRDFKALALFA